MDAAALVLVLSGSLFHLGWNILGKTAGDRLAFFWWVLLPPAVAAVPASFSADVSPLGAACVVLSGLIHAFYFAGLARAYSGGDLSFVYPYARGVGTALAVFGGVAFLGERPSFLGWAGVALALGAGWIEPAAAVRRGRSGSVPALVPTLLTGLSIGTYLVIDKLGVGEVAPVFYLPLFLAVTFIFLTPVVVRGGRLGAEWRRTGRRALAASLMLCLAYFAILAAMDIAPVSYVVAARASGIAVSGLAGWLVFRESVTWVRAAAIAFVVAGVALIGAA